MAPLRYPFTQDALDVAHAVLEQDGEMEEAIRVWMREEGFGLERNEGGQMRLVGPWLDS
jgi:hypothetical protein